MQEEWGFIDTGSHDAATNMALDEALLRWHSEGSIPPTLRFYQWNKPSLSVGHFQKVEKTIDFDGVNKHHCDYVRRLTGGSAVLHDDELTYSIVISEDHPAIPTSIRQAYYILSRGVLEGYKNLGIDVEYAIPKEKASQERTAVCFERVAYYEMVVDGKKLSGNAQTRKEGVLLQHGSIPMSMDVNILFDLFLFRSERMKVRQRERFGQKAMTINEYTNKTHTYDMVKDAFYEGFKTGLNITLKPFELTDAQWEEVHHLAKTKYAMDAKINNTKTTEKETIK